METVGSTMKVKWLLFITYVVLRSFSDFRICHNDDQGAPPYTSQLDQYICCGFISWHYIAFENTSGFLNYTKIIVF